MAQVVMLSDVRLAKQDEVFKKFCLLLDRINLAPPQNRPTLVEEARALMPRNENFSAWNYHLVGLTRSFRSEPTITMK